MSYSFCSNLITTFRINFCFYIIIVNIEIISLLTNYWLLLCKLNENDFYFFKLNCKLSESFPMNCIHNIMSYRLHVKFNQCISYLNHNINFLKVYIKRKGTLILDCNKCLIVVIKFII